MSIKTIDKETGDIGKLVAGGTLFADSPLLTVVSSYDSVAAPGWKLLTTDVAGRTLLRAEYKELFDLVTERGLIGEGKPFGEGDGSTTFVLPDAREATFKGIGLTSHTVGAHLDGDGLAVGEFLDDRIQDYFSGGDLPTYIGGEASVIGLQGGEFNYYVGNQRRELEATRRGTTTEVKSIGINYFMKVKQVSVPTDFVSAMDKIYGVLIPSDASESNKLVAKSDTVVKHNFSITGTLDAVEDTKALVNHIITLGVGTYAGEFKRSGITFGSYRLTYLVDGIYSKSVSGLVTYSINVDADATYQVSYVENIEHSLPPEWKIEKLVTTSDNTVVKWIGSAGNMTLAQIFSTYAQQNNVMYKGFLDWNDARVPLYGQGADTVEITCYDWNLTATTIHGKTFYYNSSTGVWIENSPIVTTTVSMQSDSNGNLAIYSVLPAGADVEIISVRSLDEQDYEFIPGKNRSGDLWCQLFSWAGDKIKGIHDYNIEIKYRRLV